MALSTASLALAALPVATSDALDDWMREQMSRQDIPGAALAVLEDGELVLERSWGVADIELGVPVSSETVFSIASTTKCMTGVAILMLVEEGRVDLDDDIVELVPSLPAAWRGVAVRHVLTHTSGLPDVLEEAGRTTGEDLRGTTDQDVIDWVARKPRPAEPGVEWAYNQTGYLVAKMVIESVTGTTWERFARERIFGPSGMASTSFGDQRELIAGRARLYESSPAGGLRPFLREVFDPRMSTAARVHTTVGDLARFVSSLLQGGLLEMGSLETLWSPARLADGTTVRVSGSVGYGIGWLVLERPDGGRAVGGEGGRTNAFLHFVDDGLTVILMTNRVGARDVGMVVDVADMLRSRPELLAPREASTERSTTERVEELVRSRMQEHGIPGLSFAVLRGGETVALAAYGHASLELDVPCETSTVFRIASTTKMLTAVAVMKLVEAGQVALEDEIVDLVPSAPEAWRGVTLHHVLSHTSGLPDVYPEHRDARTFQELASRIAERRVEFVPGERWSYNQAGYVFARRVVELATGKEWPTYFRETFGRPCGLETLQFGGDESFVRGRTAYYSPADGEARVRPAETIDHPWYLWSATGVNLSIEDYARLDLALRRGDLLGRDALETLWEPTRRPDGTIFGFRDGELLYGRGWAILFDPTTQKVRAVGGEGGTSTAYWHYPEHDMTVIVMTNLHARGTPLATEIADGIAEIFIADGKEDEDG